MKRIFLPLSVLFFTFIFMSCEKKPEKQNDISIKIESYLQEMSKNGFFGSVLVAYKGQILLSKGYGKSNIESQFDNSSQTVFDIGSITKQFTAAGILKLEMQGKLSVEDKITSFFENVPEDKQEITIHHLLTHSAGFPGGIGDDYEEISKKDFIDLAFQTPLKYKAGEKFNYSNVGYSLLTIIIEKVSKLSYENYLRENLFLPAKMKQTGYVLPKWTNNDIAIGYYTNNKAWGKPNEKNWSSEGPYLHLKGNGGILSTTEDMYNWHLALLGNDILSKTAKTKYYKQHIKEGDDAMSYYAYGWAIFPTPRNTNLIAHNGGNGIFYADFLRYLTEDITIILLSNKSSRSTEMIPNQIAGIILKPDFEPTISDHDTDDPIEEEVLNLFVDNVLNTLRNGEKESWENFISEKCTQEFIDMVPIEKHLSYFEKFKNRLKNGKIEGIEMQNDEILLQIKTKDDEFTLVIIAVQSKGELLLGGLGIK